MFCLLFASIFKNRPVKGIAANWSVTFGGKEIIIPLHPETFWLDWNLALSIMGHDLEVKECYEHFIAAGAVKNKIFFDIGANYGTHSVLFLTHGFRAITFEPNPDCNDKFQNLTTLNGLHGEWQSFAIGEKAEEIDLVFPKNDTWMGSLSKNYLGDLSKFSDITRIRTSVKRLDDYVSDTGVYPGFIKIDTEGFELAVIRGGRKTLAASKPIIVFESNKSDEREALFNELTGLGFNIFDIRGIASNSSPLSKKNFVGSAQANFVSIYHEQ
jgi:FkbM family methyltransferase